MYQLNYVELQKYRCQFLGCSIDIVAGDTDSFFLECRGVDLQSQLLPAMIEDELLDTSNYPPSHPLYSTKLTAAIGKFKDEAAGQSYSEWVFLRPKLYSLQKAENNHMRAKGVNLRQTRLMHENFVREYKWFEKQFPTIDGVDHQSIISIDVDEEDDFENQRYVKQRRIGTENHQLYTLEHSKLAITIADDKRLWIGPNQSVAYGHHFY